MEGDTSFLKIYDGGSEQAEMIANLNGVMNDNKISTPRNQIFAVLNMNGNDDESIRFNAALIESKALIVYADYNHNRFSKSIISLKWFVQKS